MPEVPQFGSPTNEPAMGVKAIRATRWRDRRAIGDGVRRARCVRRDRQSRRGRQCIGEGQSG